MCFIYVLSHCYVDICFHTTWAQLLYHTVALGLASQESIQMLSQQVVPLVFASAMNEISYCPKSSPAISIISVWYLATSNRWVGYLIGIFICFSLMHNAYCFPTNSPMLSNYTCFFHLCILFQKISICTALFNSGSLFSYCGIL